MHYSTLSKQISDFFILDSDESADGRDEYRFRQQHWVWFWGMRRNFHILVHILFSKREAEGEDVWAMIVNNIWAGRTGGVERGEAVRGLVEEEIKRGRMKVSGRQERGEGTRHPACGHVLWSAVRWIVSSPFFHVKPQLLDFVLHSCYTAFLLTSFTL